MSLNESIVEDAALTWFGELGYAVRRLREAIWRVNPAIPEVERATIREYRTVRFEGSTP